MKSIFTAAIALVCCSTAGLATAQMAGSMQHRPMGGDRMMAGRMSPTGYVMEAGASDTFEKRSSALVLQSTRDPAVRRFAQRMMRDHTMSTDMVKAAAMRDGVRPMPPRMNTMQANMVARLRSTRGPARDRLYMQQQQQAHQMALQLHQGYASNGSSPALRGAAGRIAPIVQEHLGMTEHTGRM